MAESFPFGYDTANEKTKLVDPKDRHSEYGYGGGPKSMYSEDQNDIELRSIYYGDQNGCGPESVNSEDQNCCGPEVIPSEAKNSRTQEAHCMVCRKSKKIKTFDDLRPGDHIEMPIKQKSKWCTVKLPIKHHAIVEEIIHKSEQEGASHLGRNRPHKDAHVAQVKVIHVPSAGKKCVPFCPGPLKVESGILGDKDKDNEINCNISKIKKVEYRRRRNTHEQTLETAKSQVTKDICKKCHGCVCICEHEQTPETAKSQVTKDKGKKYHGCVRNCEHFCVAMVNWDAQIGNKNIENTSCLQSARCFWVFIHFCLFAFQCVWYGLNFYVYAIYAQGNERYNHFGGNSSSSWMRCCHTKFDYRGVNTICDWIGLGLLLVIYIDAYVCLLYCQRTRGKDVCTQCRISARIVLITKMIFFVLMEIANIFAEKELYVWIEWFDKGVAFTIIIIACISLLELWVVFFVVPRVVVKCLVKRCLKCRTCRPQCCSQFCSAWCCHPWDFDEDSYKYVIHYA